MIFTQCTGILIGLLYVHNAYLFFKGWFQSTLDLTTDLTHSETALLRFLFSQSGKEVWDEPCIHFPFLTIEYEDSLTVAEFLLNVTYTDCISENPGKGYFRQCLGWAMGTNVAPTWSTLVLRYYERMILPLYPSLKLMRFIDDGLLFHPKFLTPSIDLILKTMYPPNLFFDIWQKGVSSHISFLGSVYGDSPPLETYCFLETHPLSPIHPLALQHSEKCEETVGGG